MKNKSISILIVLINAFYVICDDTCETKSSCKCEFEDGRGIDLLGVKSQTEKHFEVTDTKNNSIFFSPCEDIKYHPDIQNATNNDCNSGYAICEYNATANRLDRLGTNSKVSFETSNDGVYLMYALKNRTTTIKLVCTPSEERSYMELDSSLTPTDSTVKLLLFTKKACPTIIDDYSYPSTGTVLIILFLMAVFTYFSIGITVNFFYLGARGWEVVPNVDFWKDLPSLIREGYRFVRNGFKVIPQPDSYDAI